MLPALSNHAENPAIEKYELENKKNIGIKTITKMNIRGGFSNHQTRSECRLAAVRAAFLPGRLRRSFF